MNIWFNCTSVAILSIGNLDSVKRVAHKKSGPFGVVSKQIVQEECPGIAVPALTLS